MIRFLDYDGLSKLIEYIKSIINSKADSSELDTLLNTTIPSLTSRIEALETSVSNLTNNSVKVSVTDSSEEDFDETLTIKTTSNITIE